MTIESCPCLALDEIVARPGSAALYCSPLGQEWYRSASRWRSRIGVGERREILEFGLLEHRVLVTLDADFHALLALSGAREPSVIRIRIEGLRAEDHARLLTQVLSACRADLVRGSMVTVTEQGIRVRQLPLLR